MNWLKSLFKDIKLTKDKPLYRYIISDGNRTPERILSKRKYLKEFNPSIEKIDNVDSLVLNLSTESKLVKLRNRNFDYDQSITQVINDSKFIKGINGYIYLIR